MNLKTFVAVVILTQGCATLHNGRHQEIMVVTDPAGATVEVRCGTLQPAAVTPVTVRLPRRVEQCSLILSRPGFHSETVMFNSSLSGWVWGNFAAPIAGVASGTTRQSDQAFGDFALGALLGGAGFGIDALTGAMWQLVPVKVERKLVGVNSYSAGEGTDFRAAAKLINDTIRANHYHPAELDNDAYRQIEKDVIALGDKAVSADEFLAGFNAIWQKGPFSHVGLRKAEEPAADRSARLDTQIAGDGAVTLAWKGTAAILTVNTMSGADTIKAINAAYDEIVARKAEKLIIDLRRNDGGAFAVVPLVGHLVSKPIDAGVFVVSSWYDDHKTPPGPADFPSAVPWRGYSVKAFQADVLTRPLTSYRIDPLQPLFQGPVLVLTSGRSISAAEIAADALKATGRARIVGEKTPGALLSSKLFDIPGGFHLRVPIADYYSIKNGRIEGVGVTPDIAVNADKALDVALGL